MLNRSVLSLKIFLSFIIIGFLANDCFASVQRTFYVSPIGSDMNPGTTAKPWKTFFKASSSVAAGSTVIFEDGIYYEDEPSFFSNSGTFELPIIFKVRNQGKVKIIFPSSTKSLTKINIENKKYITIQGFELTQIETANEKDKTKTIDIIIACRNSENCSFINNLIYNAYEEGIKVNGSNNIIVDGNTIKGTSHEGIDFVNNSNSVVSNNTIVEVGRVGILVKGGSRNIKIHDNYISNSNKVMNSAAIGIGGMTNKKSTFDNSNNGYEAYSIVAWNNKIISKNPGKIRNGIAIMGAKNSYCFNNVIIGPGNGFYFMTVDGEKNGWGWSPSNDSVILKNNVVMDCKENAFMFRNRPRNLESDYNLYYNNGISPKEPNSIYQDPLFINKLTDWNLRQGSPARRAGKKLPTSIRGFSGKSIKIRTKKGVNQKKDSNARSFTTEISPNIGLNKEN